MPDRVKCLHVLIAHSLAKGPGLNPSATRRWLLAGRNGLSGTAIPADWPGITDDRAVRDRRGRGLRYHPIRLAWRGPTSPVVLSTCTREMRVVRLGEVSTRPADSLDEAIERTRVAPRRLRRGDDSQGVQRVRMVATSATRDAANRDDFFAMTARLLGRVVPGAVAEVITGDEEARLSFRGPSAS